MAVTTPERSTLDILQDKATRLRIDSVRSTTAVGSVRHPNVFRVVALSGGYGLEEANDRLRRNHGIVASFSRALVEGLSAQQSDVEFNALLDRSIQNIFEASNT